MGMQIWLERKKYVSSTYDKINFIEEEIKEYVFEEYIPSGNIDIAKKLKVYKAMWQSYKLNPKYKKGRDVQDYNVKAETLIPYLEKGLKSITSKKTILKNGFYQQFIDILERYYVACVEYPDATVGIYCENS